MPKQIIDLTITEQHRAKAIALCGIGGANIVTNCLIAQAVKEKFPKSRIRVSNFFVKVYKNDKDDADENNFNKWVLNPNGKYIARRKEEEWKDLELPIDIQLERA